MRNVPIGVLIFLGIVAGSAFTATYGLESGQLAPVPAEDYAIYDRVIQAKFLTSQSTVVVINRVTVTSLIPDGRPPTLAFFTDGQVFGGSLPRDLVMDFLLKCGRPARLEARFALGVRVQFVSDGEVEDQEASLAPIAVRHRARLEQWETEGIGVPSLSRVGVSPRGDQAILYVSEDRFDGGGGGYLVWLHRTVTGWQILDTEVLWTVQQDRDLEEER